VRLLAAALAFRPHTDAGDQQRDHPLLGLPVVRALHFLDLVLELRQ
jgi:hypothetical protein